ncbi:MAG: HAMP domain-containing histidine kinase [Clostridia bacterium]|nr:HAMP domain-containing histidine kinase [Clostridia bacterium]
MFKTSFSKYITAFVIIILVSFLILSGIITSMIQTHALEEKEEKLALSGNVIVKDIERENVENVTNYIYHEQLSKVITPMVNFDKSFDVMVTDPTGKILLSTVAKGAIGPDGSKEPVFDVDDGFGVVNFEKHFTETTDDDMNVNYVHKGTLGGILDEQCVVYANDVVVMGEVRGYVLTLSSTTREDGLVAIARQAVINSSIWVMLAAVIAAYFITERIVHPLRTMTGAAKSFGKGDFSARVVVSGDDEVSELGRAFNNMAESLDSLEKMRNSFLANVSHDLRTPMTTVSGFIDGITSGAIPPEKHGYYLNVIQSEIHRLSRLVSEILDVSRLESGERKFNFVDFDIAEMARVILISFEQKIEAKRLEVEFEADSDEMTVNADKDAIYQVLYNLCHNAIKFSHDGGKFAIRIVREAPKKIRVSVFDEGQTISEEDLKLVFDRFYKTDKSRGLDKSGVGLGLYISKTIVEAHGEKIWATSSDGVGAEFIFTLKEGAQMQKRRYLGEPELIYTEEK